MTDDPSNFESVDPPPDTNGGTASAGEEHTLEQVVERHGPLTWPVVRWIAFQLADFLEPLHASNRAHGSISPGTLLLPRPWPSSSIELPPPGATSGLTATPLDDLTAIARTLSWLLSADDLPAEPSDPEARRLLSIIAENRLTSAQDLTNLLVNSLLDSLPPPAEDETDPLSPGDTAGFWSEPPPPHHPGPPEPAATNRPSPLPKLGLAAAAIVLLGGGAWFLLPRGTSDTPSPPDREDLATRQQAEREQAEREQAEREKTAIEIAKREQAERELAAKEQEEREKTAREQAEREKAAKEKAARERAEREKMAKEQAEREKAAAEQAAKEKALREAEALIARNGPILENPDSPAPARETAFAELLTLARDGHPKAIELCGAAYWQGNGVAKDQAEAARWFEKGAALGNPRSMLGLGNSYEQGIGLPQDIQQAASWWRKAADAGEPLAMSRLGEYYNSDPEAKDVPQAMSWWQKAADGGIPEAMTNLGILHSAGAVGEPDPVKAVALWEKAVALGEPRAMAELGYKYFNGEIPGKDKKDAFELFQQAVPSEDPRAMTGLGVCYLTGSGTPADKAEAVKWLERAAALGEPTATQLLENLNKSGR